MFEIIRAWDRHSNETLTLRKHTTKYKNMRKRIVLIKDFWKYEARGDKIVELTQFITKSINLRLFCSVLGSVVMFAFLNWPPVHSTFIEQSMI